MLSVLTRIGGGSEQLCRDALVGLLEAFGHVVLRSGLQIQLRTRLNQTGPSYGWVVVQIEEAG